MIYYLPCKPVENHRAVVIVGPYSWHLGIELWLQLQMNPARVSRANVARVWGTFHTKRKMCAASEFWKFAENVGPVTVAHGRNDSVVPYSHSSELCALNRMCKLVTVDDERHSMMVLPRTGALAEMVRNATGNNKKKQLSTADEVECPPHDVDDLVIITKKAD